MCFVGFPSFVCRRMWHDHQSGGDSVWTDAENVLKYVRLMEMFTKEGTVPNFPFHFLIFVIIGVALLSGNFLPVVLLAFIYRIKKQHSCFLFSVCLLLCCHHLLKVCFCEFGAGLLLSSSLFGLRPQVFAAPSAVTSSSAWPAPLFEVLSSPGFELPLMF